MSNVKIYFILYIVLLCEMFIVILDRDDALDELNSYVMSGIGPDFSLVAPDSILNLTIYAGLNEKHVKTYTLSSMILSKSFLLNDSLLSVKDSSWWWIEKPPVNIDTNDLVIDFKQHFPKADHMFSIYYDGPILENFKEETYYDSCTIGIKCKFLRLIGTPRMRYNINDDYILFPHKFNIIHLEGDRDTTINDPKYLMRKVIHGKDIHGKDNKKIYVPLVGTTKIKVYFHIKTFLIHKK